MHIVTTSDNNYVSGVLTLIASAFRHNPAARFSVLAVDWHAENAARLDALAARLGCSIRMIVVDAEKLADLPVRRAHLSVAAFARLLIAELMPDAGRLIYMDADMLVTGALDEGHETPLAPQELLAAVPCPSPRDAALRNLDLAREDYFNSGFLVIDTDVWREHNLGQACIMRLAEDTGRYVSEDESALNDVCRNRYRKLPSGLNFYAQETAFQPALNDPASIRVIHYVTAPKPWQGPTPLDTLWHHEAAKIADLLPPPPPRRSSRARR